MGFVAGDVFGGRRMIPVDTEFIFYPLIGSRNVEASGHIVAVNDIGAWVLFAWVSRSGKVRQTKDFFVWDELQRIHILSMGGLCE
jgi:hypothetical protein